VARPVARTGTAPAARGLSAAARAARAALLALLLAAHAGAAGAAEDLDRFDVVVVDAGHGGEDRGARGHGGLLEKEVVLDVARRLVRHLEGGEREDLRVVLTREDDRFVPLERRTAVANDARGDLFVSIHANAARSSSPRGIETYFVSLEASDDEASRLAELENAAFETGPASVGPPDPLTAILGDMMSSLATRESNEFAKIAQRELAGLDGSGSRGVKQAPFVVLMGVQMPACLVEIGFLTNQRDETALRSAARRDQIARALARAVEEFGRRYDARRGVTARRGNDGAAGGASP